MRNITVKRESLPGNWRGWVHREDGRIILTTSSFADSEVQLRNLVRAYKEHGVQHTITVDMR